MYIYLSYIQKLYFLISLLSFAVAQDVPKLKEAREKPCVHQDVRKIYDEYKEFPELTPIFLGLFLYEKGPFERLGKMARLETRWLTFGTGEYAVIAQLYGDEAIIYILEAFIARKGLSDYEFGSKIVLAKFIHECSKNKFKFPSNISESALRKTFIELYGEKRMKAISMNLRFLSFLGSRLNIPTKMLIDVFSPDG